MGCGRTSSTHSNTLYSTSLDPHLQTELSTQRLDHLGNLVDRYEKGDRPGDAEIMALLDKEGREEEVMRPYKAALTEPSSLQPLNQSAPNVHLKLEYVYGYRSTRHNLFYTANPSKIVYPASAVGVVLNTATNTQQFFGAGHIASVQGHSDTICALAIHPNRDLVATGDTAQTPKICIWHSANLALVKQFCVDSVVCMCFSPSGRLLAVCGLQSVRVCDWTVGVVVAEETGVGRILGTGWGSEWQFCTAGVRHVCFWTQRTGGFVQRKGILGDIGPIVNFTCVGWLSASLCITGSTNGFLYSWNPPNCLRKYPICPSSCAIHCLSIYQDTLLLGCSDRKVHVLDKGFREVNCVQLQSCPRALDMVDKRILCGCRDGSIVEVSTEGRPIGVYMESHCEGGVWGLAVHTQHYVLTVGDDNKLKLWDWTQHRCLATVASGGSCVAVSPQGHIAVGHSDGHIVVRREFNTVIATMQDSNARIQTIAYSPNGALLAAAAHNSLIYLYYVEGNYHLRTKLAGHSAPVTSLDFSEDSLYLHSTSLSYDLLFWDLATGRQLPSGSSLLRDEEWATWTALLGYPVRGIYSCGVQHVKAVDRMHDGSVVAVGNEWGLIELFGYPNDRGARSIPYRAHSSVVAVKWTPQDHYLFSIGGADNCLMQWARS